MRRLQEVEQERERLGLLLRRGEERWARDNHDETATLAAEKSRLDAELRLHIEREGEMQALMDSLHSQVGHAFAYQHILTYMCTSSCTYTLMYVYAWLWAGCPLTG